MAGEGILYAGIVSPLLLIPAAREGLRRRALLWVLLAAPIVGHVFWWTHGGNRYGPRFYFEALLPFTLLISYGLERLGSNRYRRSVAGLCALGALVVLFMESRAIARQIDARRAVYDRVADAKLDRAIVLLQTASGDLPRSDLARNPPDFRTAPVLYAISRGEDLDRDVAARFPDRTIYYYRWDESGGTLTRARW
jgi:hypothetical protein